MNTDKKYIFLLAGCTLIILLSYWKVQMDDAYIFYSYVQDITNGEGFVFNPGERINASTSPLYTLILSGIYFLLKPTGITIPMTAHFTGAVFLFLAAYLLFRMFNTSKNYPLQFLIPLLFLLNPLIRNGTGMEMFLLLFLIILTFYFYKKDKLFLAAIAAAAAVLTRFDAGLILIPVGIDLFLRKRTRDMLLFNFTVLLLILPWFIFSYFYFDELLPSTVKIKLLQQSTGYWGEGLLYLKGILKAFPGGIFVSVFFIILLTVSLIIILVRHKLFSYDRTIKIMLSWLVLYFLTYSFILNPPAYIWYYTPLSLLFAIMISLGFKFLINYWHVKLLPAVLLVIVVAGMILPVKTFSGSFTEKYILYKNAAEWINSRGDVPVSAIDEIGVLRFYQERGEVKDILGLVNPEAVYLFIKKDFPGFIEYYKPDYIIADYPEAPPYLEYIHTDHFSQRYPFMQKISGSVNEITVYYRNRN